MEEFNTSAAATTAGRSDVVARVAWRDHIKIHPAADVFPLLSNEDLRVLGEDIAQRGLIERIKLWRETSTGDVWLIDGRNRLDAMEAVGLRVIEPAEKADRYAVEIADGLRLCAASHWLSILSSPQDDPDDRYTDPTLTDYIISANLRRRHLTKEQQAELIVKAVTAGEQWDAERRDRPLQDDAVVPERSFNPTPDKKGGSTKGRRGTAIDEGAKHGISKSTIERALAKQDGKATRPRTRRRRPTAPGPVGNTKSPLETLLAEEGPDGFAEQSTARLEMYLTATDPMALRLDLLVDMGLGNLDPTVRLDLGRALEHFRDRVAAYAVKFLVSLPGDEGAAPPPQAARP